MKTKLALLTILLSTFFTASPIFAQTEFPYAKMLTMSKSELADAKFKFNKYMNQHVLKKSNGLLKTAYILAAMNGYTGDMVPHEDDYRIIIQYGDAGVAFVDVIFYKSSTYHEMMTFALQNGKDLIETNSVMLNKLQYNYNGYHFEINSKLNGISSTTRASKNSIQTKDESYNIYSYTIYTGNRANSAYIKNEEKKQAKRDAKGKKQKQVSSFM